MKASIIIPTLNRHTQLISSLRKLEETTTPIQIEIVVIVDQEDEISKEGTRGYFQERIDSGSNNHYILQVVAGHPFPVEKWNSGAMRSSGEWLVLGADDLVWSEKWLELSLNTPNIGFLALRDTPMSVKFFEPHYMATREWLKKHNGGVLAIPHYKHWGLDLEIAKRAHREDHYKVSNAILPHKHHLLVLAETLLGISKGTAPYDSTYDKARPHQGDDIATFNRRESEYFPDDFEGFL